MRGTHILTMTMCANCRFIPAHAGNTALHLCHLLLYAVHPRACGEHPSAITGKRPNAGSSPRMRGTRLVAGGAAVTWRFIPAHAGNTTQMGIQVIICSVHPRACGEHHLSSPGRVPIPGSSPRMRGTPGGQSQHQVCQRFIPAHAGNTDELFDPLIDRTVHPRACGEHSWSSAASATPGGSSPRMRGTRAAAAPAMTVYRFIPAHAGNTRPRPVCRPRTTVHPRACGEHAW